jgi:hypothetical protein
LKTLPDVPPPEELDDEELDAEEPEDADPEEPPDDEEEVADAELEDDELVDDELEDEEPEDEELEEEDPLLDEEAPGTPEDPELPDASSAPELVAPLDEEALSWVDSEGADPDDAPHAGASKTPGRTNKARLARRSRFIGESR